jgi:hypothetical protein
LEFSSYKKKIGVWEKKISFGLIFGFFNRLNGVLKLEINLI